MHHHTQLIQDILNRVAQTGGVDVLQPPQVGQTSRRNELLMFAKPEIFMVGDRAHVQNSLELIFRKLDEFSAEVDGAVIVGGRALEDKEIMNRHYGFINEMSRTASQAVSAEDRAKIEALLGVSLSEYTLYGGHEFMKAHPSYDPFTLDSLWFTQKSLKVRSGFYVQAYEADGEKFVLVNGFHPVQLAHFTDPTHRIVLLLVHSDTAWSALRNDLVGVTFPDKAVPGSIRGSLYADPAHYGFASVGIGNNGVHLSAGPYEGVFEITNFLGSLLGFRAEDQPPLVVRRLLDAGLTMAEALGALKNPPVTKDGKTTDLYSATEDMNTAEAVALYVRTIRG